MAFPAAASPVTFTSGPSHHLRSGRTVWDLTTPQSVIPPQPLPTGVLDTGVVIIGTGITGAMIAERLSRERSDILLIDRHAPARGSTAASTALLLWETDTPLVELETRIGFERAVRVLQATRHAVARILQLAESLNISCGLRMAPSLYLSGNRLDPAQLRDEHRIRQRAGLPGDWCDAGAAARISGLTLQDDRAALLSVGSAEVDPVALTHGLLATAMGRGVRLLTPLHATDYDCTPAGVMVQTESGLVIRAQQLVLASGYEMPPFVQAATQHQTLSTWAIATVPQQRRPRPSVLMWEAADPYLYLRATAEGRLVLGGEDEEIADAAHREALLAEKTATLQARLQQLLPQADLQLEAAWTARFGMTADGLPLIGRVPGVANCLAAYGYGGNGITFSAMAAAILAIVINGGGEDTRWPAVEFALDR